MALVGDPAVLIEIPSASPRIQAGVERTLGRFVGGFMAVPPVRTDATDSVRGRPRIIRGGEPAVVPTAMTRNPMGPHWPGHSPPRETTESSPGIKREQCSRGLVGNAVRFRDVAGSLRVRGGTDGRRPPESDGRIPPRSRGGGGQAIWRVHHKWGLLTYRSGIAC
jgi:hypothetical protein